jgi:asparagine synthase (glutamine-hydrolysing)
MIHFSAFANNAPHAAIPQELGNRWSNRNVFPKLVNRWTYARNNVFLSIQGDCPIDHCVYTSPRLALLCYSDLLGSGACGDFREANRNPAQYIAQLYESRGDAFTHDLHGWFGIVLYDWEQESLKAWTDHFGIRRIVYRATPGALGIASDLRLLNGFFDEAPEIEPKAVLEYLQYTCIAAPRTIFKEAYRLEPGHRLVSRPGVVVQPYWDMSYREVEGRNLEDWSSQTFETIQKAVACCAKTGDDSQRLGCFLSGGTDSSSISGLVGNLTGQPPRTFSIGFDDPRYNEIEYARIAARHFRADHHEYFVTPQDILDLLQGVYAVYDEPFGNSSIIPAYYCARLARNNGTTHMLAGDGGDELFGGNQRYADDQVFQKYQRIPKLLRRGIIEPGLRWMPFRDRLALSSRAANYVRRAEIPVPDRWHSYEFLSSIEPSEVLSREFLDCFDGTDPLEPSRRHYTRAAAGNDLNRWLYLDLRITINDNDLPKVTKMCELAGVSPRFPLLDPVLADFSGTIPADLKVRGTQLRYVFKKAMSAFLPQQIIQKTKHGFGLPYGVWIGEHKPLREFTLDTLGSNACRQRNYFRPDMAEWAWSQYETVHRAFYGSIIWILLMLELWHCSHDKAAIAPAGC